MLVVDASCLYEVLVGSERAESVRRRLGEDTDHAAPHVVDAEVLGVIRRELQRGRIDRTTADQAVEDLRDWPGERFGHRALLARAWGIRSNVRTWDALYVALAEALQATLVTADRRLARTAGLHCHVQLVPEP